MIGDGAPSLEAAGGRACGVWTPYDWRASEQTIPQRVSELARQHPDRLAVFDTQTRLTYGELDRAANRIANLLLARRGRGPEAVVLHLDAGVPGIVATLGAFRAGKHVVGVEPAFGVDRIAHIARNAGAGVMVAEHATDDAARAASEAHLDLVLCDQADTMTSAAPEVAVDGDTIACLSYTSGSTGTPKAVIQNHRSAIGRVTRYATAYRVGSEDRFATFASPAWSGSLSDVFGALCLGAASGAYDTRRFGLPALPSWLEDMDITAFAGLTIARRLAFDFADRRFPQIRLIQLGGDTVYRRDVDACQRVFPEAILAVGMGTTETGRVVEQFIPPGTRPAQEVVPIGFPAPGVRTLVVDEDGLEMETGSIGEIVVHSRDNASGYWKQPELTAQRFRHDLGLGEGSSYFTGDLGRVLPGGVLQHTGRKDFQAKIRGLQVPTSEVEAILLDMPGMREACVVAQALPAGGEQLVAFLVRDPIARQSPADLRRCVAARLPSHMVPQRFVDLDALPRTAAGKPDRKALPVVSATREVLEVAYVAPRDSLEAKIASIWREILGLDTVGVHDDFLDLGGDSLQAMRIVGRVGTAFGRELPVSTLLGGNTVARMASIVGTAQATQATSEPPSPSPSAA